MYFICICKHHTLKKGFLRMSCRKSFTTCFSSPPPAPQEGSRCFNYPKEKHNKTGKNITVYCSPQWTYGLSVLILYILRVADFIIVYAFLHIPDINFRTSSGAGQGTSHSNGKTLGLYTFCTQRAYEGRRTMTFLKFAVGNCSQWSKHGGRLSSLTFPPCSGSHNAAHPQ